MLWTAPPPALECHGVGAVKAPTIQRGEPSRCFRSKALMPLVRWPSAARSGHTTLQAKPDLNDGCQMQSYSGTRPCSQRLKHSRIETENRQCGSDCAVVRYIANEWSPGFDRVAKSPQSGLADSCQILADGCRLNTERWFSAENLCSISSKFDLKQLCETTEAGCSL